MGRIGRPGIGFAHRGRGIRFRRRALLWHRRTLVWHHNMFWGAGLWDYRVARWRHVHGYHHYVEHDEDPVRTQLPPDSANFCFIPMNLSQASVVFNKIDPVEVTNIMKSIRNARDRAPNPCCTACCCCVFLFPIVGCFLWAVDRNTKHTEARKVAIVAECQRISQGLAPRGMTLQYVQLEDGYDGIVIEVQPIKMDGSPNLLWTGPRPVLDAATRKAMVMDYNLVQGRVTQQSQMSNYDEAYAQSAQNIEKMGNTYQNVNGLAHQFVVANWLAQENLQYFGNIAEQCKTNFEAACKQLSLEPAGTFQLAQKDLEEYKVAMSYQVQRHVGSARAVTNQAAASQLYATVSMEFLNQTAMPPPPAYSAQAYTLPVSVVEQKEVSQAAYVAPKPSAPVPSAPVSYQQEPPPVYSTVAATGGDLSTPLMGNQNPGH